jgi:hypothetical protein
MEGGNSSCIVQDMGAGYTRMDIWKLVAVDMLRPPVARSHHDGCPMAAGCDNNLGDIGKEQM